MSVDRLATKMTEDGAGAQTENSRLSQDPTKSNDAKSPMLFSSFKTDGDGPQAKRQKLDHEEGSNANTKPPGTTDCVYTGKAVKCAFCHLSKINEVIGYPLAYLVIIPFARIFCCGLQAYANNQYFVTKG